MRRLAIALPAARPIVAGMAIAALAALMTLAIGAALLFDTARARADLAGHRISVAVIAADPARQRAHAATILAMLRGRADLQDVHIVPEDTLRAEAGDGPLPALIDATLPGDADAAPLARALAGLPGVSVARAAPMPDDRDRSLARAARTIAAIALLAGIGVGAGIARAADTIALGLLEQLGASDAQIGRAVTWAALRPLLAGSMIGTAFAIPFIAWQAHGADAAGMRAIPISGWATMLLAALALALLGILGTFATATLRLRRRP